LNFELELLTVAIIVCAVLHILAEYKGAQRKVYLLKPLTMLLIVAMGLSLLPEKLDWYHYALLIGLLFSIGGDVALTWPSDKYMLWLVKFPDRTYILHFRIDFQNRIIP
jgi:uncharacterized membrane protein YhhN